MTEDDLRRELNHYKVHTADLRAKIKEHDVVVEKQREIIVKLEDRVAELEDERRLDALKAAAAQNCPSPSDHDCPNVLRRASAYHDWLLKDWRGTLKKTLSSFIDESGEP